MKAFRSNIGTLELTGKTRNLGHGIQCEVKYEDESTGFEHIEDFENLLYVDVHGIVTEDDGEYVHVTLKEG